MASLLSHTRNHVTAAGAHHVAPSPIDTSTAHPGAERHVGRGADFAALAAAFDALVAVLVQIGEILPKLLVAGMHDVAVLDRGELGGQLPDSLDMEYILVGLRHDRQLGSL